MPKPALQIALWDDCNMCCLKQQEFCSCEWGGGARSIAATPLMHFSQNGWNQKTRMTSLRYYETNITGDHLFA